MITGSLTVTFENEQGLVSLIVTNSDLSGAKFSVLTRYADNRSDRSSGMENIADFEQAQTVGNEWFQREIDTL